MVKQVDDQIHLILDYEPSNVDRHVCSSDCWCGPQLDENLDDTDQEVWVHQMIH